MKCLSMIKQYFVLLYLLFQLQVQCTNENIKVKDDFDKFRKQVEEAGEVTTSFSEKSNDKLEAVLERKLKDLFIETKNRGTRTSLKYANTKIVHTWGTLWFRTTKKLNITEDIYVDTNILESEDANISLIYSKLHELLFPNRRTEKVIFNNNTDRALVIKHDTTEGQREIIKTVKTRPPYEEKKFGSDEAEGKHYCIFCNNVLNEACANPENKIVPTVMCDKDEFCYSQHTPFGIVDRGCLNVIKKMTVYVCSCNLCNYISMNEMPPLFANKKEWIDDIIEMTRSRGLRKSVFKDMSCLSCEVKFDVESDILRYESCSNGDVDVLPTVTCDKDEVCGVKVIRFQGYVWRGCIKKPLFNYWLTLCNTDLCNSDKLVSIYEF